MSFKKVEELDELDFFMGLKQTPKELEIIKIGDLRESSKGDGLYFYITFRLVETMQTIDVGYNIHSNGESLIIGARSKLYPLLSHVTHINDGAISCLKSDIDEVLKGYKFKASVKVEKFGNKRYFIIIPNPRRRD